MMSNEIKIENETELVSSYKKLKDAGAMLTISDIDTETAGSQAMAAFKSRVEDLLDILRTYQEIIQYDTDRLNKAVTDLVDLDSKIAETYGNQIQLSFHVE